LQNSAVIRLKEGRLAWYPPGAGDSLCFLDEESAREQLRAALGQPGANVYFAVPGADVTLFHREIGAAEKKHIDKSLPFMLEEGLAEDIEGLHFASEIQGKSDLVAAVCTRAKMQEWQTLLADFPNLRHWIPEPLLLPWQAGEWSLLIEETVAIVRTGSFAGYSIEPELLQSMLAATLVDSAAPETLIIYGQDQDADTALRPSGIVFSGAGETCIPPCCSVNRLHTRLICYRVIMRCVCHWPAGGNSGVLWPRWWPWLSVYSLQQATLSTPPLNVRMPSCASPWSAVIARLTPRVLWSMRKNS